jgi:hypothetical protein
MMDTAFTLAYGAVEGNQLKQTSRQPAASAASRPARARPARPAKQKRQAPIFAGPRFYIGADNVVYGPGDKPVMPHDVTEHIVDKRGEHGDLGKIVWADGSTGLPKGLQLEITLS